MPQTYTAKQITELLQQEDPQINIRTIRYYTQIGLIPPLELVGNKRVYTQRHFQHFRAILAMAKSGTTLADIEEQLKSLTEPEVAQIADNLRLYKTDELLRNETHVIADEVILSMSPRLSAALKARMVAAVTQMLKQEDQS